MNPQTIEQADTDDEEEIARHPYKVKKL